jgi:hypothetical protein
MNEVRRVGVRGADRELAQIQQDSRASVFSEPNEEVGTEIIAL